VHPSATTLLALHLVLAQRDDLLVLETRRRLHQQVEQFPGLHLSELARQCGLETNHAKYHLTALETHGLVSSKQDGGLQRFYPRREGPTGPQEAIGADDKAVLAVLRQPVPLHAVLVLLDRGEVRHADLDAAIPVSRTTLHYHMAKLERAGVVESWRDGRERAYRLLEGDRLMALLLRYRPPDKLVAGFLEAWEALEL
jgi:predicted transcriptional regulator